MNETKRVEKAEHYLAHRYPVLVQELAPEDGGGYTASIPLLGTSTFVADGETAEEALEALERLRRYLIPLLVDKGVELAEPDEDEVAMLQYSGNLVLRIPKSLHGRLAQAAKREGCSINKLATGLLSSGVERRRIIAEVGSFIGSELERLLDERMTTCPTPPEQTRADNWRPRQR